jgi:hypothetical protein
VDQHLRDHHDRANELVAAIHDRMPLILAPGDYARWLSDEPDPRDDAALPGRAHANVVDLAWVNKPENDDPSIRRANPISDLCCIGYLDRRLDCSRTTGSFLKIVAPCLTRYLLFWRVAGEHLSLL